MQIVYDTSDKLAADCLTVLKMPELQSADSLTALHMPYLLSHINDIYSHQRPINIIISSQVVRSKKVNAHMEYGLWHLRSNLIGL